MAPVVTLSVAGLNPLHDLGKRYAFSLQQEVNVVGHQHVGVEPKTKALAIVLDAFEISDSVSVVVESSLPLIAADNHMIERPVKLDSGFARHGANLARGITLSQYSGLTLAALPLAALLVLGHVLWRRKRRRLPRGDPVCP